MLQQQKEALERDVREAQSAPALAESARKLGMIPSRDTAHLVQDPAGNWVVVGTPKPADGVPPPPLNGTLPEQGPPPPPPPPALPPEVPVRVQPGAGAPPAPARPGPEALLRAPDGASTLGGQHLPQAARACPGRAPDRSGHRSRAGTGAGAARSGSHGARRGTGRGAGSGGWIARPGGPFRPFPPGRLGACAGAAAGARRRHPVTASSSAPSP